VPARQGHQAAGSGNAGDTGTGEAVQPPSCGPGGAASHVSRWIQVYFHHHRPLYQMVRGGSGQEYGGHNGGKRAGRRVDRFGVPAAVTSDRGTQFTSAVWEALCTRLGIKHIISTAFHPCSNGMVERAHHQLKDALRARQAVNDWPEHLPWVLLGLRAAPKEDSGVSSAETVLGEALVLPSQPAAPGQPPPGRSYRDLLVSPTPRHIPTRPLPSAAAGEGLPAAIQRCQAVYIRKGGTVPLLAALYVGPYQVMERRPKTFTVLVGEKVEVVSVDRLKPHTGQKPLQPAAPPHRGQPQKSAASSSNAVDDAVAEGGYVESGA
jgi:hypothetical protein